jgi:hypothetical protein
MKMIWCFCRNFAGGKSSVLSRQSLVRAAFGGGLWAPSANACVPKGTNRDYFAVHVWRRYFEARVFNTKIWAA